MSKRSTNNPYAVARVEPYGPPRGIAVGTSIQVTVELAHDDELEQQAKERLLELLDAFDLSKWIYARRVRIDSSAEHGWSHPIIVLPPGYLLDDDRRAVSVFVHEQMHWAFNSSDSAQAAINEAKRHYPKASPPPEGARDDQSTWLHFPVCALEFGALVEIFGDLAARELLASRPFYTWIYREILEDSAWFAAYLRRHDLVLPDVPEIEEPGTRLVLRRGPVITFETGQPQERRMVERLRALHDNHDLARYAYAPEVVVTATRRPAFDPIPTLGTRASLTEDAALAHYLELQNMWRAPCIEEALPAQLEALVPPAGRLPDDELRAIVAACAATLEDLRELIGDERAAAVTTAHPLNSDVYSAIDGLDESELRDALAEVGAFPHIVELDVDQCVVPLHVSGRGPVVVLDYLYGAISWQRSLSWLARSCTAIVPDWETTRPARTRLQQNRWFAEALAVGAPNADGAVYMTWSLGSPGALRLAADPPPSLRGLVLVDPAGLVPPPAPFRRRPGPPPTPAEIAKVRWRQWVRNDDVDREPLEATFLRWSTPASGPAAQPPRQAPALAPAELPLLTIPTLILVGRHSNVLGVDGAEQLAQALGGEVEIFEDSAHAIQFDEPRAFAERVSAFAESVTSRA